MKQEFQQIKEKLEWEQKQQQYQIDQALLKLNEIQQEREQNKIYSAINARVLLIRTYAINNNNLTIAIKLLVNAPEPRKLPKPIPKPKPQIEPPPIQKDIPKSSNLIKAIERKSANISVSFLQNTPIYKKTHTKFLYRKFNDLNLRYTGVGRRGRVPLRVGKQRASLLASVRNRGFLKNIAREPKRASMFQQGSGKNALKETSNFNDFLYPVSLLYELRHQPVATQHHHKPSFFT